MALTRDGIETPLPPSLQGLGIGIAVLIGGIVASFLIPGMICFGLPAILIGTLMVVNQANGVCRTRVTFSKLLIEEERLVMGFLVGPTKRRLGWPDLNSVSIEGDEVVVTGHSGAELRTGKGCPDEELQELKSRIEKAAQQYAEEGGA